MQRVGARLRAGREIVVPASIGNLGPGFDTLGVAVNLYLRVRVAQVIDDGRGRLECRFASGPLGGPNRIETAFRAWASRRRRPSLVVDVRSDIPLRSGLGSSAAATIAGLRLGELVDGRKSADQVLSAAVERSKDIPDNAAPALLGGVTSCCVREDGSIGVTQWPWPAKWRIVVATPEAKLADVGLAASAAAKAAAGRCDIQPAASGAAARRASHGRTRPILARRCATACISPIGSRSCRVCVTCSGCGILM